MATVDMVQCVHEKPDVRVLNPHATSCMGVFVFMTACGMDADLSAAYFLQRNFCGTSQEVFPSTHRHLPAHAPHLDVMAHVLNRMVLTSDKTRYVTEGLLA